MNAAPSQSPPAPTPTGRDGAVAPVRTHVRRLLALAVPATAAQVGAMLLQVVDVAMLGRLSVHALDAAALGRVWVLGTVIVGMGLVLGMDPVAAQAVGAGDRRRLDGAFGSGIALALLASLPIGALWLFTGPILRLLGQEPALAADAQRYVFAQLPGLPFFLVFLAAKQFLQAQGSVWPTMWVTFAGNAFNVVANWALIFGRLGMPALDVAGAGLATSLTQVFLAVALLLWLRRGAFAPAAAAVRAGMRRAALSLVLHHGTPVAAQLGLELWAFQIATLLAGRLGEVPLAAHTAALTLASLTFMVPLGVSLAAVVRVGNLLGARSGADAQRAAWVSLGTGAAAMALSGIGFLAFRWQLPRLFTGDAAVVAAAAAILPIAAAFQVFDGLQVVGGGVLRGLGQTRPAAIFNFFGYYLLALPLAWWLAFPLGLGLPGLWWGLALGLAVVAGSLLLWLSRHGPGRRLPVALRARGPGSR
jgi:MATE family multidrug resistance protein